MYAKNQFNLDVKIIRTDNSKEFDFIELYDKHGILHKKSYVETPQQHIFNINHNLIFQSRLPKSYWSYVVAHVVYLINRLPLVVLKKKFSL